jgi:hypothetical protein
MKQFRAALTLSPILLFALTCLAAASARAACTSPAGNEKDIVYNNDFHTYQFCNGTNWKDMGGYGGGGSGGLTLISTQTASASASLQFTNLPTSYNTLFLNCANLVQSASAAVRFYLGEGAGPTWETAAHYNVTGNWACEGPANGQLGTTTSTDLVVNGTSAAGYSQSVKMYIDNVGSSSLYKFVTMAEVDGNSGSNLCGSFYTSYWNNDTNPVTAIEVVPTAGTITSGTCSLYGMN